jgi:dTDP-4-dehydrorhamnose 3,5-epimerase
MEITITPTRIAEVVVIETDFFQDERGFFIEAYHKQRFVEHGIPDEFVQDNHSRSARGVLRGFHYQDDSAPMAKLVRCTSGRILDVAVDLRVGSATCGQWVGVELSAENKKQVMVPQGFGHAFIALQDGSEVLYKCTGYYTPSAEGTVAWNDPDIGVKWPISDPLISARDSTGMSLKQYLQNPVFHYRRNGG